MKDDSQQIQKTHPKQLTIHSMFFISSKMVSSSVKHYRIRIIVNQKSKSAKKQSVLYYQKDHHISLFPWKILLQFTIIAVSILQRKYYPNLKKSFYQQVGRTNIQDFQQYLLQPQKPIQSIIIFGVTQKDKGKMLASLQISLTQGDKQSQNVAVDDAYTFQLKDKSKQKNKRMVLQQSNNQQFQMPKKIVESKKISVSQNNLYKIQEEVKYEQIDKRQQSDSTVIELQSKIKKIKAQITRMLQKQAQKQQQAKDKMVPNQKDIQKQYLDIKIQNKSAVEQKKKSSNNFSVQYAPQFTYLTEYKNQDFKNVFLQNIHIRTLNKTKTQEPISIVMSFYDLSKNTDINFKQQILTIYLQIAADRNNKISYLNQSQIRLPLNYNSILIQVIFYHNQHLYMSKITRQIAVILKAILVKDESSVCHLKLYNKKGVQMGKLSLNIEEKLKIKPTKQIKQANILDLSVSKVSKLNHVRTKSQNHSTKNTSFHIFTTKRNSLINCNQIKKINTNNEYEQNKKNQPKRIKNIKTEFSFIDNENLIHDEQKLNEEQMQKKQSKTIYAQKAYAISGETMPQNDTLNKQKVVNQNISLAVLHKQTDKLTFEVSCIKLALFNQSLSVDYQSAQLHIKADKYFYVQQVHRVVGQSTQFQQMYQTKKVYSFQECQQNQMLKIELYSVFVNKSNKEYHKIAVFQTKIGQFKQIKPFYKGYLYQNNNQVVGNIQFKYKTIKLFSQVKKSLEWKNILVKKISIPRRNQSIIKKSKIEKPQVSQVSLKQEDKIEITKKKSKNSIKLNKI